MDSSHEKLSLNLQVQFRPDQIAPGVYIAPGAVVVGDVTIGPESSVWFNAVLRGDCEAICIGARTNIQDLAMLHADPGSPCVIGDGVTVGHSAIVHAARVDGNVTVGMRAVILNGAHIGENCIVGAGAVVTQGTIVPPGSMVLGMPARVIRPLREDEIEYNRYAAAHYLATAAAFQSATSRLLPNGNALTPGQQ